MQTTVNKIDRQEIISIIQKLPESKLFELKEFLSVLITDTSSENEDFTILDLAGIWKDRNIDANQLRQQAQGI